MALFGESKEDKKEKKVAALLDRYGLHELSDPRDLAAVQAIANKLAGNNLIEVGAILSGSAPDAAKMGYLGAIVEQNWIIIRQLDKLINK